MVLIALTWIIPTIVSTGMLHSEQQPVKIKSDFGVIVRHYCGDGLTPQQRLSFILSVTSLFYVLPLCIITFTTVRIILVLLRPIPELSESQSTRGRFFTQEESKRKVSHGKGEGKVDQILVLTDRRISVNITFWVTTILAVFWCQLDALND